MIRLIMALFILLNGLQTIKAMEVEKYSAIKLHDQGELIERSKGRSKVVPLDPYEYVDLSNNAFDAKNFKDAAYFLILSAAVGHTENLSFISDLDAEVGNYLTFENIKEKIPQILSLEIKVEKELKKQSEMFERS